MLELNESLQTAVEQQSGPVEVIDPRTQVRYVLVRAEVFNQLQGLTYDDSPWTDTEKSMLAWDAGQSLGWDDMDEYEDPDKAVQ